MSASSSKAYASNRARAMYDMKGLWEKTNTEVRRTSLVSAPGFQCRLRLTERCTWTMNAPPFLTSRSCAAYMRVSRSRQHLRLGRPIS